MQKTSSWADEADNENDSSIPEFPTPPPVNNVWKVSADIAKPKKFEFGDFENHAGGNDRDSGGFGGRDGGGRPYGDRGNDDGRLLHADEVDRSGQGRRGGAGNYGKFGGGGGGGYGGGGGGHGGRGYGDREEYKDGGRGYGGGDRRGYEDRGGRGGNNDRGGYEDRGPGGDRPGGGYGDRERGGFPDRGPRGGDRRNRYDDRGGEDDAQMSSWRQSEFHGQGSRGGGGRDDRDDRRMHDRDRGHWEPPSEEMLARIPSAGPFTAFVTVHHTVSQDLEEKDIHDLFQQDGDDKKLRVTNVRIVTHKDTGRVKNLFVDFDDAESLRSALYLRTQFRGHPIRVEVAESREPKRTDRERGGGGGPRGGQRDGPRRDGHGIKPTAFDMDDKEEEWMAKRVHEKLAVDVEEAQPQEHGTATTPKSASDTPKSAGGSKANPFGNAKPRDEAEYERKREEQRLQRKKEQEEKRRQEAEARREKEAGQGSRDGAKAGGGGGGKAEGSGDWRSEARPLEARPPRKDTRTVVRHGGKEGGGGGKHEHGEGRKERPGKEHGEEEEKREEGAKEEEDWESTNKSGKREHKKEQHGGNSREYGGRKPDPKKQAPAAAAAAASGEQGKKKVEAKKEAAPPAPAEKKTAVNMFDLLGEEED